MYSKATICDATGAEIATPPLPETPEFQIVAPDTIYSSYGNAIYSVTSGATVWRSVAPSSGLGAVAGGRVLFVSGARILSEPY